MTTKTQIGISDAQIRASEHEVDGNVIITNRSDNGGANVYRWTPSASYLSWQNGNGWVEVKGGAWTRQN